MHLFDYETMVTNLGLEARALTVRPENETAEEAQIREANRQVYETAAAELRQKWRDTYLDSSLSAAEEALGVGG